MSLHKVIKYLSQLPDVQPIKSKNCYDGFIQCSLMLLIAGSVRKIAMVTAGEIFNLYTHSTKQIQMFKLSNLSLIIKILTCGQFTNKVTN